MNTKILERNIDQARADYEAMAVDIETEVLLDDLKLTDAHKKQVRLQVTWEMFCSEVKFIVDQTKVNSEKCFAEAYRDAIGDNHKMYSSTDAKNIALCNEHFIEAKETENKALRLKRDVEAIISAIETRKYSLKDITASVINEAANYII